MIKITAAGFLPCADNKSNGDTCKNPRLLFSKTYAYILGAIVFVTSASTPISYADEIASQGHGQSGSNGRAITVADVLGQSGSNGRGQISSNGHGQSGSNGRAITVAEVFGQSGSIGRSAIESAALGVVERLVVSGESAVVTVLGIDFLVSLPLAAGIRVSDYVVIALDQEGVILQKIPESYAPGTSPVALIGSVSSVNEGNASFRVGQATIDYSSELSLTPRLSVSLGEVIQVVGIQPLAGGVILAGRQYDGALVSVSVD